MPVTVNVVHLLHLSNLCHTNVINNINNNYKCMHACMYASVYVLRMHSAYKELSCQYQCKWLPQKTCLWNDPLCVERDVKLYSLTHTTLLCWLCCATVHGGPKNWIPRFIFFAKILINIPFFVLYYYDEKCTIHKHNVAISLE